MTLTLVGVRISFFRSFYNRRFPTTLRCFGFDDHRPYYVRHKEQPSQGLQGYGKTSVYKDSENHIKVQPADAMCRIRVLYGRSVGMELCLYLAFSKGRELNLNQQQEDINIVFAGGNLSFVEFLFLMTCSKTYLLYLCSEIIVHFPLNFLLLNIEIFHTQQKLL